MRLAVVDGYSEINNLKTAQYARMERSAHTFFATRDELRWNRTT